MAYSRIPYAPEQGISKRLSGNFFQEQGNLIKQPSNSEPAERRSNVMLCVIAPCQSVCNMYALPPCRARSRICLGRNLCREIDPFGRALIVQRTSSVIPALIISSAQ